MRLRVMLLAWLLVGTARTQQPELKFTTSANLVIVNVTVEDRRGQPVEGLKREDFVLLEDGKPQNIAVFDFQRLTFQPLPPAPPPLPPNLGIAPPKPTEPAQQAPGASRYQDRRLIVLFFDFTSMPFADRVRAQQAALDFLETRMTAADLLSVMVFTNRLRIVQDFTDDREALGEVIRSFSLTESADFAEEGSVPEEEQAEEEETTLFVPDETEFNIFNTDRKLSALEAAVRHLGALPEKKALVYFSSGIAKTGVENQSQLQATINAAVRANVAFYPVDARGLAALPPGGDASRAAPRGVAIFSGRAQRDQKLRFHDQQETLATLAAETGGKAFLDSNDLTVGLVQAQRDLRSYYILGYYSTNPAQDGRFRRIQVRLPARRDLRLNYRPGYFAPKEFRYFTEADKERQLEEALASGDPFTDLPLALEVSYFRLSQNRYFVPVAVKIPGSHLAPVRQGGSETVLLDFIGQVRDSNRKLVASVRDSIRARLTLEAAGQLGWRPLYYDTGFVLPPGAYRIKFLARENQTGKIGTFETGFEIPDLRAEQKTLPLSSIIWSCQSAPLEEAVGAAEKNSALLKLHPLVQDGRKLVPSITRVFRRSQRLIVYFEVYDAASSPADEQPRVIANLALYKGRSKVFESKPALATVPASRRAATLSVRLETSLERLPPGRYVAQLNVIDEAGGKFAFARSPLVVLR